MSRNRQNEGLIARIDYWGRDVVKGTKSLGIKVAEQAELMRKGWGRYPVAVLSWIFSLWKRKIWDRYSVDVTGNTDWKRAGLTLLGSFGALWFVPTIILALWQAGLMMTTWERTTVYLTSSQEIDSEAEVHAVRGCRALPCSESDAIYLRVRSSTMHDIYALFTRGQMFYPEEVAGVVAPGVNRCEVASYGIRIRALMRGWGIYPDMMDAVCSPVSEAQIEQAESSLDANAAPVPSRATNSR